MDLVSERTYTLNFFVVFFGLKGVGKTLSQKFKKIIPNKFIRTFFLLKILISKFIRHTSVKLKNPTLFFNLNFQSVLCYRQTMLLQESV